MTRAEGAALIVTLAVAACASPGIPPGGPPDVAAPQVVQVSPDSGAVNVRASSVTFRFDEVVAEGPRVAGSGGSAGLAAVVIVSPGDGRERVRWRRNAIEIEPRDGFRAGTAYRVTLLPGIADLRGNIVLTPRELVFSTGDAFPTGAVSGVVFDWAAGQPAPRARIEAFNPADSTFRWMTQADSTGRYVLRDLAPGAYALRAYVDANANRQRDERESFDTTVVTLGSTHSVDFYAFVHDTIGPRIEMVATADSAALRVRFDRAVAPDWTPTEGSFALLHVDADSAVVPLGEAVPAARFDSLAGAARALADSIALDSTARANPADTVTARRLAELIERSAAATAAAVAAAADTVTDTLAVPAPRLGRPTPSREWAMRLSAPLAPGTYLIRAVEIPGLGDARGTSEREFRIEAPVPSTPEPPTPEQPTTDR